MSEISRGVLPIEKKWMQPNYLFALLFREGFMFGRVIKRRLMNWQPWELIDSNGNEVDIAASSHQAEVRFRDPRNTQNDILYLENATDSGFAWFLHGAFGIKPQWINMYLRYPEGDIIPGKFPNIDPIRPTSGDDIARLNGINSPYEQPTDFQEVVIMPRTHIGCEYYNKDSRRAHQPIVNIDFALYWFEVLTCQEHSDLIRQISSRAVPCTFLTVGFGNLAHDHGTLGDVSKWGQGDWGFVPMTLDEGRKATPAWTPRTARTGGGV